MPKKKVIEEHDVIPDERALVFNQLKEQYTMPWERARNLIRSETMLTENAVRLAMDVARSFGLPLQGLNIIPSKNGPQAFVNSDGVRWRLHIDPRGVKSIKEDITHFPTPDEPYVHAVGFVEFNDGSQFSRYATIYFVYKDGTWYEKSRDRELKEIANLGDRVMACGTKAGRRTGIQAVGVALPIYEDYMEWRQEQGKAIEGDFKISDEPKVITEPTNLAELLSWAGQKGKTVEDILTALGADDLQMVMNNLPLAITRLKETWK